MLDGGWLGSVIHDDDGDLFAVDIDGNLDYLGRLDLTQDQKVMFDLAFSPWGELYGIGGSPEGPSSLYLVDLDLDAEPGGEIDTTNLGILKADNTTIFANGLEFRDDGQLFAVGYDLQGESHIFSIDTQNPEVETEIREAVKERSLGDFLSAGDLTFDSSGNMYVTTGNTGIPETSGFLLSFDRSLDEMTVKGWTGHNDFYGLTYGPAPQMYAFRFWPDQNGNSEVYRINPDDGVSTRLATLEHPLLLGINGAATIFEPPTDLGKVDFLELLNEDPILGELWYRLEAFRDGILTADLPGAAAEAGIQLTLYTQDETGALHEVTSGELRLDEESAQADQEYFVRIENSPENVDVRLTNLVVPGDNGADVFGTDGADRFEITPGSPTQLSIKGVPYEFSVDLVEGATFTFTGGSGRDDARLFGSEGDDVAVLGPNSGTLTGPGYLVEVSETAELHFDGGGGTDSATINGSSRNDTATIGPFTAELSSSSRYTLVAEDVAQIDIDAKGGDDTALFTGSEADETIVLAPGSADFHDDAFDVNAVNFESVTAFGGGGSDTASLRGSDADDKVFLEIASATLEADAYTLEVKDIARIDVDAAGGANTATVTGSDADEVVELWPDRVEVRSGAEFLVEAAPFESITATAGSLSDHLIMHDSPGDDRFVGSPIYASLLGDGFTLVAHQYRNVNIHASDGVDIARLYDSPDDDQFSAWPGSFRLDSPDGSLEAEQFDAVHAFATAGGNDKAELYDSPGNDHFFGSPAEASLYGDGFYNRVVQFENVQAYAVNGGIDEAKLYDSPGDDEFLGTPEMGELRGEGFFVSASNFDGVHVAAKFGGFDVAELRDSAGNDNFVATPVYGAVDGPGFYNRTMFFEEVWAYAGNGGINVAKLFDSPGDDTFTAWPEYGVLEGVVESNSYYHRAEGFDGVHAYGENGGFDTARLYDSPGNDRFYATPVFGALFGDGFYNRAKYFDQVFADASEGGDDVAELHDSALDDVLTAGGDEAWLTNEDLGDIFQYANKFDTVKAYGTTGTNRRVFLGALNFTLDWIGNWVGP